jgi:hypothetical protein
MRRTSVAVLVNDVSRPSLAQRAVPLDHEGGHPHGVARSDGVPLVCQAIDALAFQQEETVLVVVHLFDDEKLARLEIHHLRGANEARRIPQTGHVRAC